MSNRIDFYQPTQDEMTIPAGRLAVFLDGQLCPFLEVTEIIRAPFPEFGYATLKYNTYCQGKGSGGGAHGSVR